MNIWKRKKPSFGFVSTRFMGLDGVSLETRKWAEVMTQNGCDVFFMAGLLDTNEAISHSVPEAFFDHPENKSLNQSLFQTKRRSIQLSDTVQSMKNYLKSQLYAFYRKFRFDILVVQNALAIPIHIPLGLAITEFIVETGILTIAHHHDFYWERDRFYSDAVTDYLRVSFPPVHPKIQHVVINSIAGYEFGRITGAPWVLIPNVLDFKISPPQKSDDVSDFRKHIGLSEDSLLVLQPTRMVSRKGIETAAELVKRIDHPKACLVITHDAGDEGNAYLKRIIDFVRFIDVDLRIISEHIGEKRLVTDTGKRIYTLADAYINSDLVTYPSIYEGYGNAFVEAVYYRKPVVVNRYPIFKVDIEPIGFDVISFDGYITDETVAKVNAMLLDESYQGEMIETNFMLGWRYLSYEMLEEKLEQLLINFFGS